MIVAPCPRCHEPFRLPSEPLPADAIGRCPWCRETFPAAEALSGLPPALEVTSADGHPIAGSPADAPAGGVWDPAASLEAVEPSSPEPWFDTAPPDTGADAGAGAESIAPMRVRPGPASPHGRRKKGSKLRTLIGIALGPVIAVPLAGAILLALGRAPDLGFYPFDGTYDRQSPLARSSQPVASSQPQTPAPPSNDAAAPSAANRSPSDRPPQSRSLAEDLAEPPQEEGEADPAQQVLEEIVAGNASGPQGDEIPTAASEPAPEQSPESDTDESDPDEPASPGDAANSAEEASTAGAGLEDDSGEAATANGELAEVIDTASSLVAELSGEADLPDARRRQLLARAYAALARVGVTAEPADRAAVAPLLQQIEQAGLVDDFGAAAPKWLDFTGRPHAGAVLVGSLSAENDRGQVTLDSGRQVTVRVAEGITANETPQRVLALGAIESSEEGQTVRLSLLEPLGDSAP